MQIQEQYAFCALLFRMRYITRWGLMRSTRPENLSEHTTDTSIIAHILGQTALSVFKQDIRPETLAVAALYHDATEILTGDMPTPVKYKNDNLKQAYKQLELQSAHSLARLLPEELASSLEPYLTGEALRPAEQQLLKAADRISALIKCMEEEASGNSEFLSAKAQQLQLLQANENPAVGYFMQHFLPCYQKNLDELTTGL